MSNRRIVQYSSLPTQAPGAYPSEQSHFGDDYFEPPTLKSSFITTIKSSWLNILLIFVPLGILTGFYQASETIIFIFNFFALIPLAKLLGYATEEISLRTSQTIGGLLNATFGNLVELILSVLALNEGLIRVVQASLMGSILSNLLLVLGFCFLFGGYYHESQRFNVTAAQTSASLLAIAVGSLMIPATFAYQAPNDDHQALLLTLSRGCALVMMVLYVLYLLFQLKTHSHLYEDEANGEEEYPSLTLEFSIALLVSVTIFVSVCAEYLVGSIEGLSESWGLSNTFVGLILLPIVGNAAEHMTAVVSAVHNKMDLALGVALGSSMQISLLVTPFVVLMGWALGQPMTLNFSVMETVCLFISVYIVNGIISDGVSNWLEGAMLIGVYTMIGIAFFVFPETIHYLNL